MKNTPEIKGSKIKEKKISKRYFSISKFEFSILIDKWVKSGVCNYEQARIKADKLRENLEDRYNKLIEKGVTHEKAKMEIMEDLSRHG